MMILMSNQDPTIQTDILAWVRGLAPKDAPASDAIPTVPHHHGWTTHLSPSTMTGWRIAARRGSQVIVADRLTVNEVANFNPCERWEPVMFKIPA